MARRSQSVRGPLVEADWSRGIIRDLPRTAMSSGTAHDVTDYLLHRPGIAEKRGGTSYYGPAVSASVSTLIDSSSAAHAITVHGKATVDSTTFHLGDGSAVFDGTVDYLALDGDDDFIFGTGNFTIDFLLRLRALPTATCYLYDSRPTGGTITATNKIAESFGSTSYTTTATLTPSANTLYLCSLALPHSATVTSITGCGFTWVLAKAQSSGGDRVEIWRAMEASGLSAGKLTITLSGSPSGSVEIIVDEFVGADTSGTHGSGAIVQTNGNTGNSNSLTVSLSSFASSSNMAFGALDRSDGVSASPGNGFNTLAVKNSGGNETLITMYKSGQANPQATFGNSGVVLGAAVEIAAANYPVITLTTAGKVTFSRNATTVLTSTSTLTTSVWYHVAVVRNSSNVALYIGGVSEANTSDSHSYLVGTDRPTIAGSGSSTGTGTLNGWIDEFRVSNNARWTTNFTQPAAAYSSDANTMFLMHADTNLSTAGALIAAVYADLPSGGLRLATADDGHLYQIAADVATDIGPVTSLRSSPLCKPVLHVSDTSRVIFPANTGADGPYAYDGSTLGLLDSTAPPGRIAGIFKARLLLANSAANPNRLWFSPLDPSGTWDTSNAWVDFDHAVTGLATVRNTMLVFSDGHAEYLTGSVPPGTEGFDMAQGPLGDIGCVDARSIDVWQDNVVFANLEGIYMTNGAAFRSLTEPPEFGFSGIGSYWRELVDGHTAAWQIQGGVLGDFYIVTVRDASDTLVDTLMCYLPRRAWWRLANFDAGMYAGKTAGGPELYYAARDAARLVKTSGILVPAAANKNDADGSPVEPTLETRFLGSGPGLKAYEFARLTYDLRASGDMPTMAVSVAPGAEATTFSDVVESPLASTTDATRARMTVNRDAQGVTMRFAQSGPSSKTELFALEVEERSYDPTVDGTN